MNNLPTLHISREVALPDNSQYQFRFEIKSESSNRLYIVAQNKKTRGWSCSCPGWIRNRKCKHLSSLGLPPFLAPYEVNVKTR